MKCRDCEFESFCGDKVSIGAFEKCTKREFLMYQKYSADLLARAEAAEGRAEKAERERDAAVEEIPKICYYCKRRKGWKVCEDWNGSQEAET